MLKQVSEPPSCLGLTDTPLSKGPRLIRPPPATDVWVVSTFGRLTRAAVGVGVPTPVPVRLSVFRVYPQKWGR